MSRCFIADCSLLLLLLLLLLLVTIAEVTMGYYDALVVVAIMDMVTFL